MISDFLNSPWPVMVFVGIVAFWLLVTAPPGALHKKFEGPKKDYNK
jgi:hypothetical protein